MDKARRLLATLLLCFLIARPALGEKVPEGKPEDVGMSSAQLAYLDALIGQALERHDFPGAVLLVGRQGRVVYRRAFGFSQTVPQSQPMEADLIFDLASVTKPVATATSIMVLVERGRLRLWDKVKDFIPEFTPYITVKGYPGEDARLFHLLTHTSGLQPYIDAKDMAAKYGTPCPTETLVRHIARIRKQAPAGITFIYSCLNYITLAQIVRLVSGQDIAEFAAETIFRPLGMERTFYNPPTDLISRCVPTQVEEGKPLRGVVHDPLARLQGGISGNAGLFSTADDLAIFCQMLLNRGEYEGRRILSPLTVERMTEIYPRLGAAGRGLGWDLASDYATVRGDLFGPDSYGHSGYTGTSVWIDPETETFVIFLTNRVHPDDKGDIISIRSKVANVVAAAILRK